MWVDPLPLSCPSPMCRTTLTPLPMGEGNTIGGVNLFRGVGLLAGEGNSFQCVWNSGLDTLPPGRLYDTPRLSRFFGGVYRFTLVWGFVQGLFEVWCRLCPGYWVVCLDGGRPRRRTDPPYGESFPIPVVFFSGYRLVAVLGEDGAYGFGLGPAVFEVEGAARF